MCVCAIFGRHIYKCLCMEIANEHCRLLVCIRACVCVCVCVCVGMCVCVCVHVMQYQSHSPQPFVQGNDRERVPDPNWASGTLPLSEGACILCSTKRQ